MPYIVSASHIELPNTFVQEEAMEFARELFGTAYKDIERLLKAFKNGQVDKRHFSNDLDWFKNKHTLEEKNNLYVEHSVKYGAEAIRKCLSNDQLLEKIIPFDEIEAIFFISSTGMATPTIDARIMNILPFAPHTKRIPIWGLGCAGGAAGLSRAYEYCLAFPNAKVLVLSVELCSLTFQKDDISKSNLIGTSLFGDGVGCALVCGDDIERDQLSKKSTLPKILSTQSTLMPDSLDVMGWDVKNEGLYVIFSKDIPTIIRQWLKPNTDAFLNRNNVQLNQIQHFVAHPGGKKVIDAYEEALQLKPGLTDISMDVLREYGNMSSATILYVLERFLEKDIDEGEYGLAAALGPGFSSELLMLRWEA